MIPENVWVITNDKGNTVDIVAKIYVCKYNNMVRFMHKGDKTYSHRHLICNLTWAMIEDYFYDYNPYELNIDQLEEYLHESELGYIVEDYMNNAFRSDRFEQSMLDYTLNQNMKIERAKDIISMNISTLCSLAYDVGKEYIIKEFNERMKV